MASQGRPLRESRSGRKDMTGWERKDWRAGDSFSWSKGLEADAGINVMCSGDRNRSSVAESRSGGDTGPGRRLGCKAGIMDLRQYHQFSLGTQVNVLLTLRPHSRNEGMCRPAPMKAPSPPSPPQHQASPRQLPLPWSFCFILPHSSHASLFCSLYQGCFWSGLHQEMGPQPLGSTIASPL